MLKKIVTFCLALLLFLLCGCTPATKSKYEKYYELVEIPDEDEGETDDSSEIADDGSEGSSGSAAVNAGESTDLTEAPKYYSVKDFGAVGDGKTDDTEALQRAFAVLADAPKGSTLAFESAKTYYCGTYPSNASLALHNADGVRVIGNGATILNEGTKSYMSISRTTDCVVEGLNFDLRVRAHFVGNVYNKDYENGYIDVISDRDIEFDSDWTPTERCFCLKASNLTSCSFLFFTKISTLDAAQRKYRVYIDKKDQYNGTDGQLKSLNLGQDVLVPTPYIGHQGRNGFDMSNNTDFTFKNINIYNNAHFGFAIYRTKGTLTFDHVNFAPPADEKYMFSSWRDMFHCKTNSAKFIWKDCVLKGAGDDAINACSNMLYVSEYSSTKKQIQCVWRETNGSYGEFVEKGDKVVIWDVDSGELIGRANIEKVIDYTKNVYLLDRSLQNLRKGENIRLCFENHCAPDSVIENCYIEGTIRFKGPFTIKNSTLKLVKMWINCETYLEGPVPHDVTFDSCAFDVYGGKGSFVIMSDNPMAVWSEGMYRLENIVFKNCTGLKKDYFSESNFDKTTTDYVEIIPALS